jgi:hypothetical protein
MRRPDSSGTGRSEEQLYEERSDPGTHPLAGSRPPEYVIVVWASQQLRVQIQRNNAAIAAEFKDRGQRRHGRRAEPNAEIEAEP